MHVILRDVTQDDLPIFFLQQLDKAANFMAAFTSRDPSDRKGFLKHWEVILSDRNVRTKTIVLTNGQITGHVARYLDREFGKPEVTYWIGREHWGKGIATRALSEFLTNVEKLRPIYARVASDNLGSVRVLEKCEFKMVGSDRSYAGARQKEIEELIFELK